MFELAQPWVLLCLPLPIAVYLLLPAVQRREPALKVPFFEHARQSLAGATQDISANRGLMRWLGILLIWLSLVVAAANPRWVAEPLALPTVGRDLLLAVDISGSMDTPDMVVDGQQLARILVVKAVVSEFVLRREADRLGLILFGSQAYLQAPLTFDRDTVSTLLKEAQLGFAGEKTAIGDAIGLAVKRLQDRPSDQRVLILLTDGQNTAGEISPRLAADLAAQAGVKIYTIGMGATEMLVERGFFGQFTQRINPSAELDESTLQYIADTTGGLYFRAKNPQELLTIYSELDKLEPIEQEKELVRPVSSLYYWPLGLALILSLLWAFIVIAQTWLAKPGEWNNHTGQGEW